MNSFSIGAFPAWKNNKAVRACDSREDSTCPRVYGRGAISVFNHLADMTQPTTDFYLAQINPNPGGRKIDVMLWSPGEGVIGLEVVAPNGEALEFSGDEGSKTHSLCI